MQGVSAREEGLRTRWGEGGSCQGRRHIADGRTAPWAAPSLPAKLEAGPRPPHPHPVSLGLSPVSLERRPGETFCLSSEEVARLGSPLSREPATTLLVACECCGCGGLAGSASGKLTK